MRRMMIISAGLLMLAGCNTSDLLEDATFSAALSDGAGDLLDAAASRSFAAFDEGEEDLESDLDESASYAFDCSLDGFRDQVVERYDADDSGDLSPEEIAALRLEFSDRPLRRHRFARHFRRARLRWIYDEDESGNLDPDERAALRDDLEQRCFNRQAWLLESYDADESGDLDEDELAEARADLRARRAARRQAILDEFDVDEDGSLDPAERRAAAEARRQRIAERRARIRDEFDVDDSGDLDADERAALREALQARVRGEHFGEEGA